MILRTCLRARSSRVSTRPHKPLAQQNDGQNHDLSPFRVRNPLVRYLAVPQLRAPFRTVSEPRTAQQCHIRVTTTRRESSVLSSMSSLQDAWGNFQGGVESALNQWTALRLAVVSLQGLPHRSTSCRHAPRPYPLTPSARSSAGSWRECLTLTY